MSVKEVPNKNPSCLYLSLRANLRFLRSIEIENNSDFKNLGISSLIHFKKLILLQIVPRWLEKAWPLG